MPKTAKKDLERMVIKAKKALKNAYVPSTKFPFGAAVLTRAGNIYQGCNVESVISGLGSCAERVAIDNAAAHGEYCFKAILVLTKSVRPIRPCGMCLHKIAEFAEVSKHDIEIIMMTTSGKVKASSIQKMLPAAFGPRELGLDISPYECR